MEEQEDHESGLIRLDEADLEGAISPSDGNSDGSGLPLVLLGHDSPVVRQKVERFYLSVAQMFESWVNRTGNPNTARTYRRAVLNFIEFLGVDWPDESWRLLGVTVEQTRAWRDFLQGDPDDPDSGQAPATVNARISALSNFYGFMREAATSELKLPIQVPNPAHAQFIGRTSPSPKTPTRALTRTLAHRLMALPVGDAALAVRDRAILAVFLYVGVRIGTACKLEVRDFHDDPEDPTLGLQEKGRARAKRTVGIHLHCAEAVREYLNESGVERGPLFRARLNSRSRKLGSAPISQTAMYRVLLSYLEALPKAVDADGICRYSPHSLRATTATLLDEAGVPIKRIQELLGHADIRVTQNYIKLLNDTKRSASHDVPL